MKTRLWFLVCMTALILASALSVQGFIPDDADGDGVPDSTDACPAENSAGWDRDGDGCIDDAIGARHIEYWGVDDPTVTYYIHQGGAPGIGGTADNDAIVAAFDAWTAIPGTNLSANYGGTTAQAIADGLDQVNLVTFADNTYPFGLSTLAVGIATSFESDTLIAGKVWRKGEIFDADMIFSPTKLFKVGGAGVGSDIQSVATHEAGHLFGISHTAVRSSTMFYVLPGGLAARSLASDDQRVYFKGYASAASLASASRLNGFVTNGTTMDPIPGALVFAINSAAPQDTAACEVTLEDGSFEFAGLPNGSYYVSIYPLNGTSNIGFIAAGNFNPYVAAIVDNDFAGEYYDAAESNTDNPNDRTAVAVSAGSTTSIGIVSNVDVTAPAIVEAIPGTGSPAVAIDGAYLVRFTERIDVSTLGDAFSFRRGGTPISGHIAVIRDDSVIVFTPRTPLDFSTGYTLRIDTDLRDRTGNALTSDFVATFTTEDEPALSISSLSPNKGVPGVPMVINGRGFSTSPAPTVSFNGTPATVVTADPGRLTVTIPNGVTTGPVIVQNPDLTVSNSLVFTALSAAEVARGYDSGTVNLSATANAIALSPDGNYAYIAVQGGVDAVVVNAGLGGYLTRQTIVAPGQYDDVAVSPDGRRTYAVSTVGSNLIEVMSDPTAGLLFNTILATRPLNAQPRGIEIDPFGYRAYISTADAEVQVWDIRLGSPTYNQQVGVLPSPDGISLPGAMAVTPDGSQLMALGASGEVFFYDTDLDSLTDRVAVSPDPRALTVDPQGQRAYVAHDDGSVSVLSVGASAPFFVQNIETGGSLRGLDTTPAGLYLYATDSTNDNLKIVDLDETHTTFRTVIADAPMVANPVDIAMSADGIYAYSVLQGDMSSSPRMVVTTVGLGPVVRSMVPQAGQPGTVMVITGSGFTVDGTLAQVDFNGVTATAQTQPNQLVVTVPPGVTSGPVTVREINTLEGTTSSSNSIFFEYSGTQTLEIAMREAQTLEFPGGALFCDYIIKTLAFSPDGGYMYIACGGSDMVFVYDIRPASPNYNQVVANFHVSYDAPDDIAITADGKVAVIAAGGMPYAYYSDPNDPRFGTEGPAFDFDTNMIPPEGTFAVATNPNNAGIMLVGTAAFSYVDATGLSDGVAPVVLTQDYPFAIDSDDVVFHPTGRACYMVNPMSNSQVIAMNTDPASGQYLTVSVIGVSPGCTSIDVSRDGQYVYAYSGNPSPNFELRLTRLSAATPTSLSIVSTCPLGDNNGSFVSSDNIFRISPQGLFGFRTQPSTGFVAIDPNCPTEAFYQSLSLNSPVEFAFTPDGHRLYAVNTGAAAVVMYDFLDAASLSIASGNNQTGVTGQPLPAPIRVQVGAGTNPNSTTLAGVPITFQAMNNSMFVTADGLKSTVVVATDAAGFAEIDWQLGDVGANSATASATGLVGSPVVFSANAVVDPATLPLSVAEVLPLNGSSNISLTTALLATFSRAVNPASVTSGSFYLRQSGTTTPIAGTFGFTDGDRRVSITPSTALSLASAYEIVLTASVQDPFGGALTNPGVTSFATVTSVPLRLRSVSPPSALVGVSVVLSGAGFDADPSANTVLFNDVPATPISGTVSSLTVRVPTGAVPGTVRVQTPSATSNALTFNVLAPNTSPIDEVIATIGSGTGAKTCAVTGDGALVYTVSPEGDVIIPVDVDGIVTYAAIAVGDQPVAIVIHPNNRIAYVANFRSGSVSVIDIDPASGSFNTVIQTILVGTNPVDLAVAPDGSRLGVANAGSSNLSVIDANEESITFHEVLANIGSGTGARSVAVSGDGVFYLGTNAGFTVISPEYEVLANIGTGTGSRSVAISPDGTLLFILGDNGNLLVVDVQPGSPSEYEVLANIGTGTGARSVAVSGDGTQLYLIPEVGDEVLVFQIEVIAGVSATDPDAVAPSFQVNLNFIKSVAVGGGPTDVVIDPSGSGLVFVVNSGDETISILNGSSVPTTGALTAEIEVTPQTLNLNSNGKYVAARIEIAGVFPETIDISTVRLENVVPALLDKWSISDSDLDGTAELEVKFDRAQVQAVLPQGEFVPVTVSGVAGTRTFAGTDIIRTIRPSVTHPLSTAPVIPGSSSYVAWTTPQGYATDLADVHLSLDNGTTWTPLTQQVPNSGSVAWVVPNGFYEQCLVLVTLWNQGEMIGQGMSPEPFVISTTIPTRLASVNIGVEDGVAVLRWETSIEIGMEGFEVIRSQSENGLYRAVGDGVIAASGNPSGGRYEFRDTELSANRTYWYKLREVAPGGDGAEFGPYSVVFRLAYELDQNAPNPFNPTTTIKYAIAADGPVSLTIYDVSGRRVRTLVDETQRANVYRAVWDGRNDNGEGVASGMYFYKLVAGKYTQTRKMMLLK